MDYVPLFVANNFYKNRTEFKREHVVYNTFTKFPKVDRYINVGRLVRQRSQLLVEMPYVRHTRRRHVEVSLPYDKEALDLVLKKRWHVYEDRPLRDVAEMCSVSRRVVNSDPSRLEMVKELWKTHPKLIIFYNFNYELEILRSLNRTYLPTSTSSNVLSPKPNVTENTNSNDDGSSSTLQNGEGLVVDTNLNRRGECTTNTLLSSGNDGQPTEILQKTSRRGCTDISESNISLGRTSSGGKSSTAKERGSLEEFEIAEWNGHKHQALPTGSRWIYLVQYTAGAEGWNCTTTDAMILYSKNYSWKITEQAYGRNDRLNTPFKELWYYGFTSESWIDKAIQKSLNAKESFNEAKYAGLFRG